MGIKMSLLEIKNLNVVYKSNDKRIRAVNDFSLNVNLQESVGIVGESGSGKTTLLNILASLDKPTSGEVLLNGNSIVSIKEKEISAFRRDNLGFVFQDFNLLDTFSIQDNIFLPLVLAGKSYDEMKDRLQPIAKSLGINDILLKYPYEVSGGQKQRIVLLLSVIKNPRLLVLDEPFVGLDPKASFTLKEIMKSMCEKGCAIFFSTHVLEVAEKLCNKVAIIKGGKLVTTGDMNKVKGDSSLEEIFLELINHE